MSNLSPTRSDQFSLRQLMIAITTACVFLSLPGGYIPAVAVLGWATLIVLSVTAMTICYRPLYRLLAGPALRSKPNGATRHRTLE